MAQLPTGTVTFLMSDIEGSTRLLQRLGDRYAAVLDQHNRIVRAHLAAEGGVEISTEGDSFFAAFTTAPAAVRCVVGIQRDLHAGRWPADVAVRVRMGLHSGEGVLGGSSYVGLDVHRVARIMASAHGGQVVLSAAAAKLAEYSLPEGTGFQDLGRHELRDLDVPEHLYQLTIDGLDNEFPPLRTRSTPRTNVPPHHWAFIGRSDEAARVAALIRDHRLVTLTGAAGVGKTSLAIEVARGASDDFGEGVWMVDVPRVSEGSLLASAVAKELGITETPTQPIAETLAGRIGPASLLLVLDGCEHLVGAAARFAEDLVEATSGVHVLVTSREPLSVRAEHVVRVGPLAVPGPRTRPADLPGYDSVALFIDRAQQVQPGFRLDESNAPAVAEICRRLDGIPLAIELAAARLRMLSIHQVAQRLEEVSLLSSSRRDAQPHHQTLQSTLDWSYDLLAPDEQLLFTRLAVFVGSFSLEAVEEVCSGGVLDDVSTFDALARLVDVSLVLALDTDPVRYRLLEPIAQYARSRLATIGEAAELEERHAAFYLDLAERASTQLLGPDQVLWAERLEQERHNVLAALARMHASGDAPGALRMAGAIQWFWVMRREVAEGSKWFDLVLADRAGSSEEAVVRALNGAGSLAIRRLEFAEARRRFSEALEICRRQDDLSGIARQKYFLATVAWFEERDDQADLLAAEAQMPGDEAADRWTQAWVRALRATLAKNRDDHEAADELMEESHRLFEAVGGHLDRGWSHLRRAALARDEGRYADAKVGYQAGRALLERAGDTIGLAHADAGLGALAWMAGERDEALAIYIAALEGFSRAEEITDSLFELKTMVQNNPSLAELRQVALWNKERAAMPGRHGTMAALAEYLYHLGKNAHRRGELERARAALVESAWLCREAGDFRGGAAALIRLGRVALDDGDPDLAAVLLGAARNVAEIDGFVPFPPVGEPGFDEVVRAAQAALGDRFDAAWRRGTSSTLRDAVDLVRPEPATIESVA
jgi:predicted ATPase/class 3 adenylate cyclase